jgi:hypothetical protein
MYLNSFMNDPDDEQFCLDKVSEQSETDLTKPLANLPPIES